MSHCFSVAKFFVAEARQREEAGRALIRRIANSHVMDARHVTIPDITKVLARGLDG